jgi:hypothetical protein
MMGHENHDDKEKVESHRNPKSLGSGIEGDRGKKDQKIRKCRPDTSVAPNDQPPGEDIREGKMAVAQEIPELNDAVSKKLAQRAEPKGQCEHQGKRPTEKMTITKKRRVGRYSDFSHYFSP